MPRFSVVLAPMALLVGLFTAPLVLAQDATPAAGAATTVVASGLVNPRGFTWDIDGTLLVASAGVSGEAAGLDAIADGCPVRRVDGFPNAGVAFGRSGIADVATLDGQLYLLAAGGDTGRGQPANGVYRVEGGGESETVLVADVSAFVPANPVSVVPPDYDPDGVPFAMDAVEGAFWITDGNNSQVLRAGLDGAVSRIVDLSVGHTIPTGIVAAPSERGGAFVALFTPTPYPNGGAKIVHVAPDGVVSDQFTGLTTAIDVAIGPDGALYALEMATGNTADSPFLRPGTGRIVRQGADGGIVPVATGLTFPGALEIGPDGALYVSLSAFGADAGEGRILRLDPNGDPASLLDLGTPAAAGPECAAA